METYDGFHAIGTSAADIFFCEGSKFEKKHKEPKKKSTSPATPVFTKKENVTLAQRIEILDWHHKHGRKQTVMAQHFTPIYPNLRIKQPLISD
jgi:hypothetical protein